MPNNVYFLPWGRHVDKNDLHHQPNNDNYLFGGVFEGVTVATFINSYGRRVAYLGVARRILDTHGFSVNYIAGMMLGYRHDLKAFMGKDLARDPGPVISVDVQYELNPNLSLAIATYGGGFLFGISYHF